MKGPTRPSSSALLLVASLFVCYHTGVETYHGKLLEKQNIILHRAVRTLLGFSESPQQDVLGDTRYQDAPKYMMDLYEKYKHSAIRKGRQRGNTVRSIPSDIGQVEGESMFIFNLSSILKSERVFNAEIHLYKKKMKTRMKRPRLKLVLYEIAPSYISEIGSLNINARGFGWQWYDVTSAVKSCMAARRRMPHLLAVKFSAERSSGKHSHVTLRKFMRQATSTPFLIVFSNDTQNITLDHIDPHFNAKELEALKAVEEQQIDHPSENDDDDDDDKDGDVDDEEDVEEPEKTSPTEMVHKAKSSQDGINSQELMTEENRERRSILDNEIPEHPHEIATPTKETTIYLPKTNPGILRGRHNQKNKGANSKLIPYPENSQRRRRRKKHRKNRRRNNKKELPFPGGGSWSSSAEEPEDNSAAVTDKDQLCGRRKLVVDFADVGWSEWIISPKSFEAHYCAGKCPFPLTKGMRPSNHATIQSIVHAIGIHADVPAPCCVPDVMGSVTLLYFDENRNVVLKNYPNMSVVSCACR